MSVRRLYLDAFPGERRGVVTLDGLPEQLFIERDGVESGPRLGARYLARVAGLRPEIGLARLDLGDGGEGVLALGRGPRPHEGALLDAEVTAEARADKAAVLKALGTAQGQPGLIDPGPTLEQRLQAAAPGQAATTGQEAREAADEAEEAALSPETALPGGLVLTIEPTRALVAVDIDRAAMGGVAAKGALDANLRAIRNIARLLRLKALAGSIVIDLIGFPAETDRILSAAREAFAPDGPGISVLPPSRLGLLQVSKPHRRRPLREQLLAADGRLSARSLAQRLARALEREGRARPGARLSGACAKEVAAELEGLVRALGPRFSVQEKLGWDRLKTDIVSP